MATTTKLNEVLISYKNNPKHSNMKCGTHFTLALNIPNQGLRRKVTMVELFYQYHVLYEMYITDKTYQELKGLEVELEVTSEMVEEYVYFSARAPITVSCTLSSGNVLCAETKTRFKFYDDSKKSTDSQVRTSVPVVSDIDGTDDSGPYVEASEQCFHEQKQFTEKVLTAEEGRGNESTLTLLQEDTKKIELQTASSAFTTTTSDDIVMCDTSALYQYLASQFSKVFEELKTTNERLGNVEKNLSAMDGRLIKVEDKMGVLEQKVGYVQGFLYESIVETKINDPKVWGSILNKKLYSQTFKKRDHEKSFNLMSVKEERFVFERYSRDSFFNNLNLDTQSVEINFVNDDFDLHGTPVYIAECTSMSLTSTDANNWIFKILQVARQMMLVRIMTCKSILNFNLRLISPTFTPMTETERNNLLSDMLQVLIKQTIPPSIFNDMDLLRKKGLFCLVGVGNVAASYI